MTEHVATNETILVVGGGISGMTAALEAAETGKNVVLVEKNPALGGRTSQLYRYFPKLCHPTCGLEINLRRLKNNPRVRVLTLAEVTGIEGSTGNYTVSVKVKPRYVNENCTACGDCGRAVETMVDDPFNYNLGQHKAAFLPNAIPDQYLNIGSFTTVDLTLRYAFEDTSDIFNGLAFSVSAQNLFDQDPPLVVNTGGSPIRFDPSYASPLGRMVSFEISKKF